MSSPAAHLSAEAKASLPRHVAIIMDGNGRWARQRHLPRIEGHRAGAESARTIIRACGELGVSNFLLWQISYAELVITQTLCPDFRKPQLYSAIEEYHRRHRRFG